MLTTILVPVLVPGTRDITPGHDCGPCGKPKASPLKYAIERSASCSRSMVRHASEPQLPR